VHFIGRKSRFPYSSSLPLSLPPSLNAGSFGRMARNWPGGSFSFDPDEKSNLFFPPAASLLRRFCFCFLFPFFLIDFSSNLKKVAPALLGHGETALRSFFFFFSAVRHKGTPAAFSPFFLLKVSFSDLPSGELPLVAQDDEVVSFSSLLQ